LRCIINATVAPTGTRAAGFKKGAKIMRDEIKYGRYLYQPHGVSYFEHAFSGVLNTAHGHSERVKELNEKDRGRYVWKWQVILKNDFDYPAWATERS
jgi:hypothetical protein